MSEKIDYKKYADNEIGWSLITAMLTATDPPGHDIIKKFEINDDRTLDVELKINGVEVSFVAVIERMMSDFDAAVKMAAEHLLHEKCRNLFAGISQIEKLIDEKARELLGFKGE